MLELIPWISIEEVIHNGRVQGSRGTQITIYYDFFFIHILCVSLGNLIVYMVD